MVCKTETDVKLAQSHRKWTSAYTLVTENTLLLSHKSYPTMYDLTDKK